MKYSLDNLREKVEGEGGELSPLLPANWISVKGNFSPDELILIANAVKENYIKLNGNKK